MFSGARKAISQEAQNAIDAKLLMAIVDHDNAAFERALSEGANIEAIGVIWDYEDEPSDSAPLSMAIEVNYLYGVKRLLALGANLYTLNGGEMPPFSEAILHGNEKVVQAMLAEDPKLLDMKFGAEKHTPLHTALLRLTTYSLIEDGDWGSRELENQVAGYYNGLRETLPTPLPAFVSYKGNLDVINILIRQNPRFLTTPNGLGFTPLDIVMNPRKYWDRFSDSQGRKTIRYLTSDQDPNDALLCFQATLTDRTGSERFSIVVHYDFTTLRGLFASVADVRVLGVEHQVREHTGQMASFRTEVEGVRSELSTVKYQQDVLSTIFQSDIENRQAVERFRQHPNLLSFYRRFYIQLEASFISFKAVAGGQVVGKSGDFAVAKSIFEFCSDSVSIAPIVGPAAEKFLKWTVGAALEAADDARQTNTVNNVSRLVTLKEASACAEIVARWLTDRYHWQLQQLATLEAVQSELGKVQATLQQAKHSALKEQAVSPAEHLAVFAVTWVMDVLYNIHKQTVNDSDDLSRILLAAVTEREPSNALLAFWGSVTAQLGWGVLPTISGDTWRPEDLLTRSGLQTPQGHFGGLKTDFVRYGWRQGTIEEAAALGLRPIDPRAMYQALGLPVQVFYGGVGSPSGAMNGAQGPYPVPASFQQNGLWGAPGSPFPVGQPSAPLVFSQPIQPFVGVGPAQPVFGSAPSSPTANTHRAQGANDSSRTDKPKKKPCCVM